MIRMSQSMRSILKDPVLAWHAATFMTTTALFDDSWLLPGVALERKLDMTQRNDLQPGTDKQKMSKLDP